MHLCIAIIAIVVAAVADTGFCIAAAAAAAVAVIITIMMRLGCLRLPPDVLNASCDVALWLHNDRSDEVFVLLRCVLFVFVCWWTYSMPVKIFVTLYPYWTRASTLLFTHWSLPPICRRTSLLLTRW
jgi:hypothetical protein